MSVYQTKSGKELDPSAPLSDYEKYLLEKFFADPSQLPQKFKSWVADYVSTNGSLHVSNIPTLKGEEWREVGASGQPAFGTNWGNFAGGTFFSCAFRKDAVGRVYLRGLAQPTANQAALSTIFTLPAGYVPSKQVGFATSIGVSGANAYGRIDITAAGLVQIQPAIINGDWVFLDVINFLTS